MSESHRHAAPSLLERTRAAAHAKCFFCGTERPAGIRLEFRESADGSVSARFEGGTAFEGYPETIHGGVVAGLLDSAMTNCLFSRGIVAVTAELTVRYLNPVRFDQPTLVTAAITGVRGPLYYMRAELAQGPRLMARAKATFMSRDRAAREGHPRHSRHTTTLTRSVAGGADATADTSNERPPDGSP